MFMHAIRCCYLFTIDNEKLTIDDANNIYKSQTKNNLINLLDRKSDNI